MRRIWLTAALGALLCTQTGCLDSFRADTEPHSQRTASAYPPEPPQIPTELTELVNRYTDQLKQVVKGEPEEPPVQPQARPRPYYHPAPAMLLPLEGASAAPAGQAYPFGQRVPIRQVTPSDFTAVLPPPAESELDPPPVEPDPQAQTRPAAQDVTPPEPNASLEDVIAYYEALAVNRPDDLQLHLRLRMMYLAARQDEKALASMPAASQQDSEQVLAILRAMIAVRDGTAGVAPADAAPLLLALQNLRERLMAVADLQVPALKLCKSVSGFGQYETFPSNEFAAGRGQPIILYMELRNHSAVRDESGLYRTRLNLSVDLFDPAGRPVESLSRHDKDVTDVSANRRNDFYLTHVLILPDSLPAGEYTVKVTVEDPAANKAATAATTIALR